MKPNKGRTVQLRCFISPKERVQAMLRIKTFFPKGEASGEINNSEFLILLPLADGGYTIVLWDFRREEIIDDYPDLVETATSIEQARKALRDRYYDQRHDLSRPDPVSFERLYASFHPNHDIIPVAA